MTYFSPLSSYRWYRKSVGGTWYCYLSNISWQGFYRKWSKKKPKRRKDTIIVEVESYNKIFDHKWIRRNPISIKRNYSDKVLVYYSTKQGFLFKETYLLDKDINKYNEE
jgi:hypothetical protein